jgi:hypothetical protein
MQVIPFSIFQFALPETTRSGVPFPYSVIVKGSRGPGFGLVAEGRRMCRIEDGRREFQQDLRQEDGSFLDPFAQVSEVLKSRWSPLRLLFDGSKRLANISTLSSGSPRKLPISLIISLFPPKHQYGTTSSQQVLFRYVQLIRDNMEKLATVITLDQGKTLADSRGNILRGLQVVEAACNSTAHMMGEVIEVAKDIETRSYRMPLGVVAAICPFSISSPTKHAK